jgi:hypothetical protein
MKKNNALFKHVVLLLPILIILLVPGCSSSESQSNMDGTNQGGYNVEELNNYGEWDHINNYGNVWHPYVVNDWMPFDNGHWSFANNNWTWISYEPFGWIVYHYGYWFEDPFYGWVWIPSDDIWSPARVMWVDYDDYVGWAPLPPHGITYRNPWEDNEKHHWHVVRHRDFTHDDIRNYSITNPIIRQNSGKPNTVSNKPPDRIKIEESSGRSVSEFKLQHQTIPLSDRVIKKMNLPQQEIKRLEKNTPRVNKEVLVPREEFRKRQSERNQQREKETQKK